MDLIVLDIFQAVQRDLHVSDVILRLLNELHLAFHGDGVAIAEPVSRNCLAPRVAAHTEKKDRSSASRTRVEWVL